MKILSINAGSSSLKFTLFELPEEKVLISGYFEKIGISDSFYSIKINGEKIKKEATLETHSDAVKILIDELLNYKVINSLDEIDGIGHRIVHGGDKFSSSVIISDEVIDVVRELIPLAPLHNPANLIGIEAFKNALPNTPMVGVFDTAFHQTMPEENYLYSVPYSWYRDYKIRKYGFHGTSHKYITKVMQEKLGKENINIINAHVGSGGSLCCVKDGKCFDTTMGFSPNAGITMGTRCGDIDYSIIPFYMEKTNTSLKDVDTILNKQSGLLGISEKFSDHRDIEAAISEGDRLSTLANNIYVNKVAEYIAKYFLELEGNVDAITLTAGTGENAANFRAELVEKLACFGIKLDKEVNNSIAGFKDVHEGVITTSDSKIPVYVIPTDEELMIALDTYNLINQ
ncbi:MAG: acetate kinase [Bacilli bacterium]|nr:acetate kinase [Bacilli bacterium]